ncbi:MAG: hypothetical protein J7L82_06250, partial [Staphylothermus sp.]|nr:hypothetical protein [Staphylothermus sp.]
MRKEEAIELFNTLLTVYGWKVVDRSSKHVLAEFIPVDPFIRGINWINGIKIHIWIPDRIRIECVKEHYTNEEIYTVIEFLRSILLFNMKELLETGV